MASFSSEGEEKANMDAPHVQRSVPGNICMGLFVAGGMAILAMVFAVVSCLKMLSYHSNGFSNRVLAFAAPLVTFLREKTLWDLAPAFQLDHPISISAVLLCVFVGMVILIRATVMHGVDNKQASDAMGSSAGRFWRIPFLCAGPVTNYTVTFNGPVTNPQVLQMAATAELDRITSDLEKLMQAVANEGVLPDEKKKDACDLLHTIAEEAQRPERERKTAVVKAVLNAIPVVISTAKSLVDLWTEIQPHLISFFL